MEHRLTVVRRIFPDLEAASRAAADRVRARARAAVADHGRFDWVLAGGHTPANLYRRLASDRPGRFPWRATWVYFGDERAVGPRSTESNYAMARDQFLAAVPIPRSHILRIPGEVRPLDAAARQYERAVDLAAGGRTSPRFDLVLLGMGPDGHTASLFPGAPALNERRRRVLGVARAGQPPYVPRITLTLPALADSSEVLFLVAGEDKAAAYAEVVRSYPRGTRARPASLVRSAGTVRWFVDRAAARRPRAA